MSKSPSVVQEFSVREFFARFSSDDACLAHLMEQRYGLKGFCPTCGVETTFHRITERKAFSGAACGHHVYPQAGTIFQDSRTPLQTWYYAIYLFIATRHGVSGKELQRQLGVTYKTAWRMGQQIRDLMTKADGLSFTALKGHVELDETFVGGPRPGALGRSNKTKSTVFGLRQRGGRLVTEVVSDTKMSTIKPIVLGNVESGATVSTDQFRSYGLLGNYGYTHGTVNHHEKEWARGEYHVNTLEGFWKMFKASIRSTHIHVSNKHMKRYISEFTFRVNHRQRVNLMFDVVIGAL
ncbi:IS1595 family transposase [soil metagenome]